MRLLILILICPLSLFAQNGATTFNVIWNGEKIKFSNPNGQNENEKCVEKVYLNDSILDINLSSEMIGIDPSEQGYKKFDTLRVLVKHCKSSSLQLATPTFRREKCLAIDSAEWNNENKTISWQCSEQLFYEIFTIEAFDTKSKTWVSKGTESGFKPFYNFSLKNIDLKNCNSIRVRSRTQLINHNCSSEAFKL